MLLKWRAKSIRHNFNFNKKTVIKYNKLLKTEFLTNKRMTLPDISSIRQTFDIAFRVTKGGGG